MTPKRYYGLDRSLMDQYWHYLSALGKGDLGRSVRYNQPVGRMIVERLSWTLLFGGAAPGFAVTLAVLGFTLLGVGLETRLNPRTASSKQV